MIRWIVNILRVALISVVLSASCIRCVSSNSTRPDDSLNYRCTGKQMRDGEGAIFFRVLQTPSKETEQNQKSKTPPTLAKGNIVAFKLLFQKVGQKKNFVIQGDIQNFGADSGIIAPTRAGRYRVLQAKILHSSGAWLNAPFVTKPKNISVHQRCVSNLGDFNLENSPPGAIKASNIQTPTSYFAAKKMADVERQSVLNAYKPEEFPDLDVPEDAPLTTLATVSSTRMIKTLYRLDSPGNRADSEQVVAGLRKQELEIRKCFINLLDRNPSSKATSSLSFSWDKDESKFSQLELKKTNVKDPTYNSCLIELLRSLSSIAECSADFSGILTLSFEASALEQKK